MHQIPKPPEKVITLHDKAAKLTKAMSPVAAIKSQGPFRSRRPYGAIRQAPPKIRIHKVITRGGP